MSIDQTIKSLHDTYTDCKTICNTIFGLHIYIKFSEKISGGTTFANTLPICLVLNLILTMCHP